MAAEKVIVVGSGIGGLAAAMRLAHAGADVEIFEAGAVPGGKLRALPSAAGPVDAGPTVLTLRAVFDTLFAECGLALEAYLRLEAEPVLARHFWPDGATVDLHADPDASAEAVARFAGARAATEFRRYHAETRRLFRAFEAPVMLNPRPSLPSLALRVAADPALLRAMAPLSTLAADLARRFHDPRLAQLFGRYATYVGGLPDRVPALLGLIWQAEARGIWRVEGGTHRLALGMAEACRRLGGTLVTDAPVASIGRDLVVTLGCGARRTADRVVFNGDPRALREGFLGEPMRDAVPARAVAPRSLSADVWAFAATPRGADLHHHNVFFGADPASEFRPIARGEAPADPTIYVCAGDRGTGRRPPVTERFQTIANAAPLAPDEETRPCPDRTFEILARRGLSFVPMPERAARTTPAAFAALFPGSLGSLYGRSPAGMMATFQRSGARSRIRGLYLAGGGVHPGPGLPMAALSGRHAAEAIMRDRTSPSTSPRTATPGGMSTGSARTAPARSRSSGS